MSLFETIKTNYAPVLTSLFLMNTRASVDKAKVRELSQEEDGESFETDIIFNVKGRMRDQPLSEIEDKINKGEAPEICHKPVGVKKGDSITQITKLNNWNPRGKSCFKMKPFVLQNANKYIEKVKGPLKKTAKIRTTNRICNYKKALPYRVKTASNRNLIYENSVRDLYGDGVTDWQEPVYWRGVDTSNMILQMEDPGIENADELSEAAPENVKRKTREKLMKSLLASLKKGADDESVDDPVEGIIPALRARKKKASESLKNINEGYAGKSFTGDLEAPGDILSPKRKEIIDRYLASIENDNNKHLACDVMTRNYLGMKKRKHDWELERLNVWTPWKEYGISYDDLYKSADSASNYALIGTMILAPPPFSTAADYIGMAKWGSANVREQMSVQEAAEKAKGELDAKLSQIEKEKNNANMGSIGMLLWVGMSAGVLNSNAGGLSFRAQIDKADDMLRNMVAPSGGKLTAESVRVLEKGAADMMKSVGLKPIDILPEKLIGKTFEQAMTYTKSRMDFKLKILQRQAVARTLGIVPATKTASDSEILPDFGRMKMEEQAQKEAQKEHCSLN